MLQGDVQFIAPDLQADGQTVRKLQEARRLSCFTCPVSTHQSKEKKVTESLIETPSRPKFPANPTDREQPQLWRTAEHCISPNFSISQAVKVSNAAGFLSMLTEISPKTTTHARQLLQQVIITVSHNEGLACTWKQPEPGRHLYHLQMG